MTRATELIRDLALAPHPEGGHYRELYRSATRRPDGRAACTHIHFVRVVLDRPGALGAVPAGEWQAARPLGDYALIGCTVAPGFEFSGFRMLADDAVESARFRRDHPDVADLI